MAALPVPEQQLWLDRASFGHWSLAELRAWLKAAAIESAGGRATGRPVLQLSICGDRQQRWEAAPPSQSKNLIDWPVGVLDSIAAQIID